MELIKNLTLHSNILLTDIAYEFNSLNNTIAVNTTEPVTIKTINNSVYSINSKPAYSNYVLLEVRNTGKIEIKINDTLIGLSNTNYLDSTDVIFKVYSIVGQYQSKVLAIFNKSSNPTDVEISKVYLNNILTSFTNYQIIGTTSIVDYTSNLENSLKPLEIVFTQFDNYPKPSMYRESKDYTNLKFTLTNGGS